METGLGGGGREAVNNRATVLKEPEKLLTTRATGLGGGAERLITTEKLLTTGATQLDEPARLLTTG